MLINRERDKLIQAINFFVRNTRKCGKVKLYKLLYFLDFEHFKQAGRSVTGLRYNAWPMGPVPVSLHNELESPSDNLLESFEFGTRQVGDGWMLKIAPKVEFSEKHFSAREVTILRDLAKEYRDSDAEDMIEAAHLENMPWDQVYVKQGRKQQEIPYSLAVRPDEASTMMRVAREREELMEKLR
jgi:uncharacterized phage-associated protein